LQFAICNRSIVSPVDSVAVFPRAGYIENMPRFNSLILLLSAVLAIPAFDLNAETVSSTPKTTSSKTDVKATTTRPRRPSARERAAARRAAREEAAKAKTAAEREKWLARLKARDVEAWPEAEPDKEHEDALAKSREMIDDVISLFPATKLYETEHFLLASNIPPDQVTPYAASVDKMYEWMCRLYGVPRDHKVWLGGKAPVFAFLDKAEFDAFEERYFPDARQQLRSLANVYGLSHLSENGEVVISCYRGNDPNDFGQMLVHETSHGFIHRYKTKAQLPNWVDEGMADLIGAEMVPTSAVVKNREYRAIQQLTQQRSLGGMLTAERIEAWQYGAASNLNRFLLNANREGYVRFIEALKEGQKFDEALRNAYGSAPDELLAHYGRWIGVADLRP
jgi:hypothetical protein